MLPPGAIFELKIRKMRLRPGPLAGFTAGCFVTGEGTGRKEGRGEGKGKRKGYERSPTSFLQFNHWPDSSSSSSNHVVVVAVVVVTERYNTPLQTPHG